MKEYFNFKWCVIGMLIIGAPLLVYLASEGVF